MLLAEYDYDTDIAVQRREAFDDGVMQGLSQGISQGRNEGARDAKIETAKNLLSIGLPQEQIASVTGLSPEEIEKL
jgi:predicted transposase/invertase (TIGR01784 family)